MGRRVTTNGAWIVASLAWALVACGRVGYEPRSDDGGTGALDSALGDASSADALDSDLGVDAPIANPPDAAIGVDAPSVDAGAFDAADGGGNGSFDASRDAGTDASMDAGTDAPTDAGADASDAADAGHDVGLMSSDGGPAGAACTSGGAVEIPPRARPYFAEIVDARTMTIICAGAVIDRGWVLTAASCFSGFTGDEMDLLVIAGDHDRFVSTGLEQVRGVVRFVRHEDFAESPRRNDIAVVELMGELDFDENVAPIALPADESGYPDTQCLVTTDYYALADGLPLNFAVPHTFSYEVVPMLEANDAYALMSIVVNDEMVPLRGFMNGGQDVFLLGVPAALEDGSILVGLNSFQTPVGSSFYPQLFTRVFHYVPWIEARMAM